MYHHSKVTSPFDYRFILTAPSIVISIFQIKIQDIMDVSHRLGESIEEKTSADKTEVADENIGPIQLGMSAVQLIDSYPDPSCTSLAPNTTPPARSREVVQPKEWVGLHSAV